MQVSPTTRRSAAPITERDQPGRRVLSAEQIFLPREVIDDIFEKSLSTPVISAEAMSQRAAIGLVDRSAQQLVRSRYSDLPALSKKASSMFTHLLARRIPEEWRDCWPGMDKVLDFPLTEKDTYLINFAREAVAHTRYYKHGHEFIEDLNCFLHYAPNINRIVVTNFQPDYMAHRLPDRSPLQMRLNSLRHLSLNGFSFSSDLKYLIDDDLTPNLVSLDLSRCELTNEDLRRIPFAQLKSLKTVDLTGNSIDAAGIKTIVVPNTVHRLTIKLSAGAELDVDHPKIKLIYGPRF